MTQNFLWQAQLRGQHLMVRKSAWRLNAQSVIRDDRMYNNAMEADVPERPYFAARTAELNIEKGTVFAPKFDDRGLIPVIASDAQNGDVVMFAYMNDEALARTIQTGEAHYWSRSRSELWHKGATSGNIQRVVELRTDCDQDAILMKVELGGAGAACHVGYRTCFYRSVALGELPARALELEFREDKKLFDPKSIY